MTEHIKNYGLHADEGAYSRHPGVSSGGYRGPCALMLALGLVASGSSLAQSQWENLSGHPGALARDNLEQHRQTPPPVDFTGTWGIQVPTWQFPIDGITLKPEYQAMFDRAEALRAEGKVFNNDVGQCWPPGVPMMMNRVWPINLIQLPTSMVIISNFMNQVRWIYMDGREHSDPDLVVPSYNGESIGWWEGDTLVVDTRNYEAERHWVRDGVPVSYDFRTIERFSLNEDGTELSIEYTMTDPNIWEGEWVHTKKYNLEDKVDFVEVHCLPTTNDGIITTSDEYRVTE